MSTHSSETPTTQPLDHNQSIDSPSVASTTLPPAPVSPKQSPRRRGKYVSLFIVALLICSAGGFAGGWVAVTLYNKSDAGAGQMVNSDGTTVVTLEEEAITNVAAKVSSSVVSIVTTTSARSMWGYSSQGAGDWCDRE